MQTKKLFFCLIFMVLISSLAARAQLVSDGGTATINGITTNITGSLTIGNSSSFTTLIVTNAGIVTNTTTGVIGNLATSKTNQVIVTGANSVWGNGSTLAIGSSGSFNQLIVTNGGMVQDTFGNIGNNSSSTNNTVVVTGNNSVWLNSANVGVGSSGSFNRMTVSSGGSVSDLIGRVGFISTSSNNIAVITGVGSQWTTSSQLTVGEGGSFNQLIVTNGGKVKSGGGYIGANNASTGTGSNNSVLVTGAGSTWTNTAPFTLGDSGSFNQLTVTNGGVVGNVSGDLSIASAASSRSNAVMVAGANSSLFVSGLFHIGVSGSFNQLVVKNGGVVAANTSTLGFGAGSTNNFAMVTDPGSVWANSGNFVVGGGGPNNSLLITNAGTLSVNFNLSVGFTSGSSNNAITVAGGNLFVTNNSTSIIDVRRGTINLNSGLLSAESLLLTNGALSQFVFNGGTLQSFSTTDNNGSTFVVGDGSSSATFELLGSGSHSFSNGLRVASNALLKGNGTIIGNVTNASGGTLSPGASIGKLTIISNLVLAAGSTNVFELNKALGTNDNIVGLSSVTYGGTLVVTNLGGALANNDAFKLFTASTYDGAFSKVVPAPPGAGLRWNTNGLSVDGTLRVANVPTLPPVIGSVARVNGTNLVIGASGGVALDPLYLLTATNLTTPMASWISLATNYFNASGTVNITNAITPFEPQRYYRLQVN